MTGSLDSINPTEEVSDDADSYQPNGMAQI
jgi:hypothetical protein